MYGTSIREYGTSYFSNIILGHQGTLLKYESTRRLVYRIPNPDIVQTYMYIDVHELYSKVVPLIICTQKNKLHSQDVVLKRSRTRYVLLPIYNLILY